MKKLAVCSCVAVLLFSSANVFALPKVKRIKISGVNVRVKNISKVAARGAKYNRMLPKVTQATAKATKAVTDARPLTLEQRVEQAVWLADFSRRGSYLHPRPHAEVPTRMHAYRVYQWAEGYSKQKGDPSILVREEPEITLMLQQRNQLSEQLQAKVKKLHTQHQHASPAVRKMIKHYDNLRQAEIKRHQDIEKNIIDRQMQGDTQVQSQHEAEMNRHLDEMDAINASEIQAFHLLEE